MASFEQAIEWLKEGKEVRCSIWEDGSSLKIVLDDIGVLVAHHIDIDSSLRSLYVFKDGIQQEECKISFLTTSMFYSDDWEVVPHRCSCCNQILKQ